MNKQNQINKLNKLYKERNKEIALKHKQGKSYNQLAREYDLTPQRISQICERHKDEHLRKET